MYYYAVLAFRNGVQIAAKRPVFTSLAEAEAEAARLRASGLDVHIEPVKPGPAVPLSLAAAVDAAIERAFKGSLTD